MQETDLDLAALRSKEGQWGHGRRCTSTNNDREAAGEQETPAEGARFVVHRCRKAVVQDAPQYGHRRRLKGGLVMAGVARTRTRR
jgi:hypothetical protein